MDEYEYEPEQLADDSDRAAHERRRRIVLAYAVATAVVLAAVLLIQLVRAL